MIHVSDLSASMREYGGKGFSPMSRLFPVLIALSLATAPCAADEALDQDAARDAVDFREWTTIRRG